MLRRRNVTAMLALGLAVVAGGCSERQLRDVPGVESTVTERPLDAPPEVERPTASGEGPTVPPEDNTFGTEDGEG